MSTPGAPRQVRAFLSTWLLLTAVTCGGSEIGESGSTSPANTSGDVPTGVMSDIDSDSVMPFCGDGVQEGDEACDDGYHNGQYSYCTIDCMGSGAYCGDGVVQGDAGEECDGGSIPTGIRTGHDCSSNCRLATPIISLAVGHGHTCVLLETGKVRCWGRGAQGQLGYGNTNSIGDNEMPFTAGDVDVGGVVTQLVAGGDHTCALLNDGKVRCWGSGEFGQLGYGNTNNVGDNETPALAGDVNVGGNATQIGAGNLHTCALLTTGSVRCWGWNRVGQLGYGNTEDIGDNEDPAVAGDVPVGGEVDKLFVGGPQTCTLLSDSKIRCWGQNFYGQLGHNLFAPGEFCEIEDFSNECASSNPFCCIGDGEVPSEMNVVDVGGEVLSLAAGSNLVCALLANGAVRCWGLGTSGRLGYNHVPGPDSCPYDAVVQTFCGEPACCIGDNEPPLSLGDVNLGGDVVQLSSSGSDHVCALLEGEYIRCWGRGNFGQLGYGSDDAIGDDEVPASVGPVNVGGKPIQVVTGESNHTCALLEGNVIRCWGSGDDGKLGYGNTMSIGDMPGQLPPPDVQVF